MGRHVRGPLVAASRYGEGRLVVFGHGGFLEEPSQLILIPLVELTSGLRQRILCAEKWAGGRRPDEGEIRVGVRIEGRS